MNINIEKGLSNPAPTTEETGGNTGTIGEIPDNSISESKLTDPVKTKLNAAINKENTGVAASLVNALEASLRAGSTDTLASLKTLIQGLQSSDTTHAGQISALQSLVGSNDLDLDTVQEIVTYIKSNKTVLDAVLTDKLNVSVYNAFLTQYALDLATKVDKVEGKGLSDQNYTLTEKNKLAQQTGTNTGDQDLSNLVVKVTGKGLSTEDYTTTEKTKLGGIATGATANSTDAALRDRGTHTGTQSSDTITEGTNKFWTNARTITSVLTGYAKAATASAILVTDTFLSAFGKVEKYIEDILATLLKSEKAWIGFTTAKSSTGTLAVVEVWNDTLLAANISPNTSFTIHYALGRNNSANPVTFRLRADGILIMERALSSVLSFRGDMTFSNRNSYTIQRAIPATNNFNATTLNTGSAVAWINPAINTVDGIVFSAEILLANTGDTGTFEEIKITTAN